MTLPSFFHGFEVSNSYEDPSAPSAGEFIPDFSESDLDEHGNRQREQYSPVPSWPPVNTTGNEIIDATS